MSSTKNMRAMRFALRELFLADPTKGFKVASMSARTLSDAFCLYDGCRDPGKVGCRVHTRAMMVGLSKMIVAGDVLVELSNGGVVYVRLSPKGVVSPTEWTRTPGWMDERPGLVAWAKERVQAAEVRDDVRRWEARV